MKLRRLEMIDFLSHRNTTIDFPEHGIVLLFGENGAGKTSIIDAIVYALTGSAYPRATNISKLSQLLRRGAHKNRVTLTIENNGELYRIERAYDSTLQQSKTSLAVFRGPLDALDNPHLWQPVTDLPKEASERWRTLTDHLFGISSDSLLTGNIILQGATSSLVEMTPGQLRDRVMTLFLGKEYDKALAKLKKMEKKSNQEITEINGKITALTLKVLSDDEVSALQKEIEVKEAEIRSISRQLAQGSRMPDWVIELWRHLSEQIHGDIPLPKDVVEIIQHGQAVIETIEKNTASKNKEIATLKSAQASLRESYKTTVNKIKSINVASKISLLENRLAEINEELAAEDDITIELGAIDMAEQLTKGKNAQEDVVCPLCGSQTTVSDLKQHYIEDLLVKRPSLERQKRRFASLKAERDTITRDLGRLRQLETNKTRLETELKDIVARGKSVAQKISDAYRVKARNNNAMMKIADNRNAVRLLNYLMRLSRHEQITLDGILDTLTGMETWQTSENEGGLTSDEVAELRDKINTLRTDVAKASLQIQESQSAINQISALQKQMKEKVLYNEAIAWVRTNLEKGTGSIPDEILKEALEEVGERATVYAKAMYPNLERIEFEQHDKGVEIMVVGYDAIHPVYSLSTGEKAKIGLAVRLAIAATVARQLEISFVLADETLANLDKKSRRQFLSLLMDEGGIGEQVIIVSHVAIPLDALQKNPELYPWYIHKDNNTSKVITGQDATIYLEDFDLTRENPE